jgi:sRNA-binding protein
MSSLTHDRLRTQRQIRWPLYREQREHMAEIFPAIAYNGGNKVPLALGVKYDLIGANTGFSAADIKHFLRAYTFGPKYLQMLKVGARRYALDGTVDGFVNENEARYAGLCLKAHNAMRHLLRKRADKIGLRAVEDALEGAWQEAEALLPVHAEVA